MSENKKSQVLAEALKSIFKGLLKLIFICVSGLMKFIAIASEKVSEWSEQIAKGKS